ncbi:3'-5' exonuclease [Aliivibrio fischeri]|uniref:3'-5' exonuclease n=1 Tax=Aliivibrio fischeri TaxID=668 RepID=UPI0007C5B9F5|nr:3'-5' exonuclease [Aliivibrio fischeri]
MNYLQRLWWQYKLRTHEHLSLFHHYSGDELVSIDCETTSLNPNHAELVSIAAIKIKNNRVLTSQTIHLKLTPPQSLNSDSIKIHQLRHQDLHHGLSEQQAMTQLLEFIGSRPIVGYHIRYDKKILDRACLRHFSHPLPNSLIEVSHIYHNKLERLLPNAYYDLSIEAISKHLELPQTERHDALEDAIAAALIYVRLTHGDFPDIPSSKNAHSY